MPVFPQKGLVPQSVFRIGTLQGLLAVIVLLSQPLRGAEPGWNQDFAGARQEARRTGKPLLIHFYADWCKACRRMERNVLHAPQLVQQLRERIVGVKVDGDQRRDLLEKFDIQALPSDIALAPGGKTLWQTAGYQDRQSYLKRVAHSADRFAEESPFGSAESRQAASEPTAENKSEPNRRHRGDSPPKTAVSSPGKSLVGLDGYSPVSLWKWREWRRGKAQFAARYRGIIYWMRSRQELRAFQQNPARYAPRLLGYDPVLYGRDERTVRGSTRFGAYFQDRLYLFATAANRERFHKTPGRYVPLRKSRENRRANGEKPR